MCLFCSGVTYKKFPGGNMYISKDNLCLCGEAANMTPEFATVIGKINYCPECGDAISVQKMPVCEKCGAPYKILDDEPMRYCWDKDGVTPVLRTVPVRSVVKSCDCDVIKREKLNGVIQRNDIDIERTKRGA